MAKVVFQEVALRGTRKWTDADGKRHQETRKFWQTLNPYNTVLATGKPKTVDQILDELKRERTAWLNSATEYDPIKDGDPSTTPNGDF